MPHPVLPALVLGAVLATSACGASSEGGSGTSAPGGQAPATSAAASPSSAATSGSSASGSPTAASSPSSADGRDVVADPPAKSWKDAWERARRAFPEGKVSKIELEPAEGGGLEYKVELISADTTFAAQYDADTLAERSAKKDSLGDDASKKQAKTFDPGQMIALDDAAEKARSATSGTITKWKIEGKDDGRVQYEFDVRPAGASEDTEVQIDARNGSVLSS